MEDEAELFKDCETDSTSRNSSKESISSASSQIACEVTTKILDRAAGNVSELMQSISWWETEELSKLDDNEGQFLTACGTNEKVEWQLQKFFHLRRVFEENQESTLALEMDSTSGPSGQEGHHGPTTERKEEKCVSRNESKLYKKMKSAWKSCFKWKPSKKVTKTDFPPVPSEQYGHFEPSQFCLRAEQDVAEIKESTSKPPAYLPPDCATPKEATPTTPLSSSDDIKASEKPDLISVPLELVDVEDEDSSQKQKEEVGGENEAAAVVAQLPGLKNAFFNIIKGFFDSLTEEQRRQMSLCVYHIDVKKKLAEMSTEVLRLFMETIIEMISLAIKQFAPPNGNLSTGSLTLSQGCGKEMAGKKLPSELFREKFDIPEDKLQLSLNGSFGKAFWDVVGKDTSISTTPTFNEAIVRKITDKVNSVLSDTIKASLDGNSSKVHGARCRQFINCRACREMSTGVIQTLKSVIIGLGTPRKKAIQTVKTQKQIDQESKGDRSTGAHTIDVHQKRTKWWSCLHKWRKTKIQPDSVKLMDEAVGLTSGEFLSGQTHSSSPPATSSISSVHSISLNSGTLELNHNEEDEDTTLGKPLNTPSSHSICSSPSACHNVMVPDYCEGPSLSKPLAKVRSSSFHQSGDSGDGNIQSVAGTDEVVMSASDTDKSCRLFCCKGKKKEDKMASAQDRAVRTKRLSLFKRILLCCCHLEDD